MVEIVSLRHAVYKYGSVSVLNREPMWLKYIQLFPGYYLPTVSVLNREPMWLK